MGLNKLLKIILAIWTLGAYAVNETPRDPFFQHEPMLGHLQSVMLPIHYAKAKTIAQFLAKNSTRLLSTDGAVEADDRTNLLYLRDHVENIQETLKIVRLLDIAEPQILIKARLVNVDDDSTRALGALFSTKEKSEPSGTPGDFEIPILKIRDSALLEVELSALEQAGHAKTISNPEIMTLSREPAFIESGEEIPYQELTPVGGTTVTFKKAELSLKVVPTLMPNQHILLELMINQDKVSPISINGAPAITTQSLQTQALVLNRQTIVLGGIYEQNHSQETNSIPGLAKIPVAGHLFRHKKSATDRKELLILITPEIVRAK